MQNKITEIKMMLKNALQEMPKNFDFSEINFYVQTALQKIEQKEKKEIRKNKNEIISSNLILQNGTLISPQEAKLAIEKIDELIAFEQKKIQSNKAIVETPQKTLID